jgi:hypothetical protein
MAEGCEGESCSCHGRQERIGVREEGSLIYESIINRLIH